jgi:hypothetical protein
VMDVMVRKKRSLLLEKFRIGVWFAWHLISTVKRSLRFGMNCFSSAFPQLTCALSVVYTADIESLSIQCQSLVPVFTDTASHSSTTCTLSLVSTTISCDHSPTTGQPTRLGSATSALTLPNRRTGPLQGDEWSDAKSLRTTHET